MREHCNTSVPRPAARTIQSKNSVYRADAFIHTHTRKRAQDCALLPGAPNLPTVAEAGHQKLEQEVLYVAMVPAATPDAVVQTQERIRPAMLLAFAALLQDF